MISPTCCLLRHTGVLTARTEFRDENDTQLADGANPQEWGAGWQQGGEMVGSNSAHQHFGSPRPLTCERVTLYSPFEAGHGQVTCSPMKHGQK